MHTHDDRKIKTCPICQKNIREIIKSGKELNRLGVWTFPKKIEKGVEYTIWEAKGGGNHIEKNMRIICWLKGIWRSIISLQL